MDVSVVIPTHNQREALRRCLEATLAQRFDGAFEVLVADDGSTDGTGEMVRAWATSEPRLRYLRQNRRGPAAARNLGIRHAAARLVALTDDDAIPQPGWLAALRAAAGAAGVRGVEGRVTPGRAFGPAEAAPVNETGGVYLTCNMLYHREALVGTGGFDERFPYAAFEDCDLAARVGHQAIAWAPQAVVVHPPRPLGWAGVRARLRHWPWAMVTARRHGYLGWPRYPARHPRARVLFNAVVKVPAGRLRSALRSLGAFPAQAVRAAAWALAEPFLALALAVPEILRFELDSAAFAADYLGLDGRLPRLAVIVVHYKQPERLAACVRSFQQADYPGLRVIVVESAAEPASLGRLQQQLPGVEWVVADGNVGYTGGNNLGMDRALALGCEYLLLVNADTECIAGDFPRRLARFLELNPRVGLAGPRVFLRRPGAVQNTVLRYPSLFRQAVDWFGFRLWPGLYHRSGDRPRPAEMLNGVCVLLRAAAVRQVGAFDPRFFMYIEDADLGLRLRSAGWQVVYLPIDSVVHHQPESGYDFESQASLLLRRNAVYFLDKHRRPAQAWALAGVNLALSLARAGAAGSMESVRRRLAFSRALWREFRDVL